MNHGSLYQGDEKRSAFGCINNSSHNFYYEIKDKIYVRCYNKGCELKIHKSDWDKMRIEDRMNLKDIFK